MYVCICNAVTDSDIRSAAEQGARRMRDLARDLKVGTCCGRCVSCAKQVLNESIPAQSALHTIPVASTLEVALAGG